MQDYQEDINVVEGYLVDELDAVVIFADDEPIDIWNIDKNKEKIPEIIS